MPEPEPGGPARQHPVARAIDSAKRHPVVLIATTVVAVLVFFGTVSDVFGRVTGAVTGVVNPHQQDYEHLEQIELGVTPQYLAERLGTARRSIDLCKEIPCPTEAAGRTLTMNLYQSEFVAVRALFEDSGLEWFAITLLSDDVNPPMKWLGHDLGALGDVTFAQALEAAQVEPTDVDVFLGPESTAYVEVVAAGAPADHRGLLLAVAPDGWSGDFERDAADVVERLNDAPYDPAVAGPFRSASQPNTYGEFLDDGGTVSVLASDPEFDRALLYVFTSL
ncbi:hypothetical protein FHX44_115513 [Pseudonocardia hierapolitana]|uniref:Uncharacterized protein n=1 Tax=Pseudonocardia hierapolitana TaxID=1128676 RepID=A0A561SXI1_9PSEU|nr:ETEC_3214 domain-containing protein [Pseudonocardia hierapolitana]TWF79580.1 hypothetical protein FHX44_115513 [Pseudonocardia hierapolitana]